MEDSAIRQDATPELKSLGPAYLTIVGVSKPQAGGRDAKPELRELGAPHLKIVGVLKPTACTPPKSPARLTHYSGNGYRPLPDNSNDGGWE